MNAALPTWQISWAEAAKNRDPHRFVTGVLGVLDYGVDNPTGAAQLEKWQFDALMALKRGEKRISIRSGHGVGKTTFLAWLVLYGLLCLGPDTKIPIAAGSRDQLRDTIQPEIGKWARLLPEPLQKQIQVDIERVTIKVAPDDCFAVFRTASASNPQALAGFHAKNLMFLIDEASAVNELAFEVALGALSTPGAIVIMTGNPTKLSGFFYDSHHKGRDRWFTMRVSSEDVPRARGHIEDILQNWGRGNKYRIRVLGEFPTQEDETIIGLSDVMAAVGRDVTTSDVWPVWGLDVARFGDDTTALAMRQGNTLLGLKEWRLMDGNQIGGRIKALYADTPNELKPREIVVDVIGVGAAVYDNLRLPGSPVADITRGCNVAEVAAISEQYHRLRDELWFRGRAWFRDQACRLPTADEIADPEERPLHQKLIAELTTVTYDFNGLGKHVVERKDEMKKRGLQSPNLADCFLLSLAAGIYPKSNPHSRRAKQQPLSWLAA